MLTQIKHNIANSIFNRDRYTVQVELKRLARGLMMYVNSDLYETDESVTMGQVLGMGTPIFQRKNDKWGRERQINFVENLISGYRPTIQLYAVDSSKTHCWILDGLQRLTAITAFINGEFKIFDGQAGYNDLNKELSIMRNSMINLEIFTFGNHAEAAKFYIALNRGITHSAADIERAEKFIEDLV